MRSVFAQLRTTLEHAVGEGPALQLSFADLDPTERAQVDRDREAWATRLATLDDELDREVRSVTDRYSSPRELVFPFGVALVVPDGVPA